MPQGNFAAYSPQEQIAAARQLLASRGLPINADNINRAMHALYTNSDFVPPATVARTLPPPPPPTRALPLPPEFPEQVTPRLEQVALGEVEREQPPNEQPPSEAEAADRANALEFFLNVLPRVAAFAPGPLGVAGRAASFANLLRRSAGSRPVTPATPPTPASPPASSPQVNPPHNPWINRQAAELSDRFKRLFTKEQPGQRPRSSLAPSRARLEVPQYDTRTRRFTRRARRQNAAESN